MAARSRRRPSKSLFGTLGLLAATGLAQAQEEGGDGGTAAGAVAEEGPDSAPITIRGMNTCRTDLNLTKRLDARASWDATSKIRVSTAAAYWHDTFDDQFTEIVNGGQVIRFSDESADSYSLDLRVRYQATRTVSLECGGRYTDRGSTGRNINIDNGFTSTVVFCNGVLALRG